MIVKLNCSHKWIDGKLIGYCDEQYYFQNVSEGYYAASCANIPDIGDYFNIEVHPAPENTPIDFQTVDDWLF